MNNRKDQGPNVSPIALQPGIDPKLMEGSHGHVIPRPDGTKANCAGPAGCRVCQLEYLVFTSKERVSVMEGFNLSPGDKLLLIADPRMPREVIEHTARKLKQDFPEIHITIVIGFTGVQVHREEPSESIQNT